MVAAPARPESGEFATPTQEADWTLIETLAKKHGAYDHCFFVLHESSSDSMLAAIGKSAAHISVLTEAYIRKYAVPGATVQRPTLFRFVTWGRVSQSIADGRKERERLGDAECGVIRADALDRASRLND